MLINDKIFFRKEKRFHKEEGFSTLYLYTVMVYEISNCLIRENGCYYFLFHTYELLKKGSFLPNFIPSESFSNLQGQIEFYTAVICHIYVNIYFLRKMLKKCNNILVDKKSLSENQVLSLVSIG